MNDLPASEHRNKHRRRYVVSITNVSKKTAQMHPRNEVGDPKIESISNYISDKVHHFWNESREAQKIQTCVSQASDPSKRLPTRIFYMFAVFH